MAKRTGPSNQHTQELIQELKKLGHSQNSNFWKTIATQLEKSTRQRRIVNLSKIEKTTYDKEVIIVPGKVLGNGSLTKNVTIAAFQWSETAREKVKNRMSIQELMKKNPTGKGVRIIG